MLQKGNLIMQKRWLQVEEVDRFPNQPFSWMNSNPRNGFYACTYRTRMKTRNTNKKRSNEKVAACGATWAFNSNAGCAAAELRVCRRSSAPGLVSIYKSILVGRKLRWRRRKVRCGSVKMRISQIIQSRR